MQSRLCFERQIKDFYARHDKITYYCIFKVVLHKLKHMAPYNLRKQLTEMLLISKLDYCNTVYSPIHNYQLKRLQHIQNACTGLHVQAPMLKLLTSLILVGCL